jgi:hypothetical protein
MESEVIPAVAAARDHGIDLQISETNSVSCGGRAGISDVFAAAAWGLDWMLDLARLGVRRVNFHTVNASYAVIQSTASGEPPAMTYTNEPRPLYYALRLFSAARGQRFLPLIPKDNGNVRAYALTACDECPVLVFVINKELDSDADVKLQFGVPLGAASMLRVQAPALNSPVGSLDYAGQRIDRVTGLLGGAPVSSTVSPEKPGVYTFRLPNAAVVLLTIPRRI